MTINVVIHHFIYNNFLLILIIIDKDWIWKKLFFNFFFFVLSKKIKPSKAMINLILTYYTKSGKGNGEGNTKNK